MLVYNEHELINKHGMDTKIVFLYIRIKVIDVLRDIPRNTNRGIPQLI